MYDFISNMFFYMIIKSKIFVYLFIIYLFNFDICFK